MGIDGSSTDIRANSTDVGKRHEDEDDVARLAEARRALKDTIRRTDASQAQLNKVLEQILGPGMRGVRSLRVRP